MLSSENFHGQEKNEVVVSLFQKSHPYLPEEMNDPIWLSHIGFKWVVQKNHQLESISLQAAKGGLYASSLMAWMMARGEAGWGCCGNRGPVGVGAVVEMDAPLKLILVLGMFKMMTMFFF